MEALGSRRHGGGLDGRSCSGARGQRCSRFRCWCRRRVTLHPAVHSRLGGHVQLPLLVKRDPCRAATSSRCAVAIAATSGGTPEASCDERRWPRPAGRVQHRRLELLLRGSEWPTPSSGQKTAAERPGKLSRELWSREVLDLDPAGFGRSDRAGVLLAVLRRPRRRRAKVGLRHVEHAGAGGCTSLDR